MHHHCLAVIPSGLFDLWGLTFQEDKELLLVQGRPCSSQPRPRPPRSVWLGGRLSHPVDVLSVVRWAPREKGWFIQQVRGFVEELTVACSER